MQCAEMMGSYRSTEAGHLPRLGKQRRLLEEVISKLRPELSRIDSGKDGEKRILCGEHRLYKELKVLPSRWIQIAMRNTGVVSGTKASLGLISHGKEARSS